MVALDYVAKVMRSAAGIIADLAIAADTLKDEAEGFSVSGVYFHEECFGHKGPDMVELALLRVTQDERLIALHVKAMEHKRRRLSPAPAPTDRDPHA